MIKISNIKYQILKIKNSRHGFTLIELLTVILIIGILASIVAVGFTASRIASRDARRKADVKNIQNALESYYAVNKKYPKLCATDDNSTECTDLTATRADVLGTNKDWDRSLGANITDNCLHRTVALNARNNQFLASMVPNFLTTAPVGPLKKCSEYQYHGNSSVLTFNRDSQNSDLFEDTPRAECSSRPQTLNLAGSDFLLMATLERSYSRDNDINGCALGGWSHWNYYVTSGLSAGGASATD